MRYHSIPLTRRGVIRTSLGIATVATLSSVSSCAAGPVAGGVAAGEGAGGAAAVTAATGPMAGLLSLFMRDLALTIAAAGVVEVAKEHGMTLVDGIANIFDDDGCEYEPDKQTLCRGSGSGGGIQPVAFPAVPVSQGAHSQLMSLVSLDGHRIDLLPRAAQALAGVASELGAKYDANEVADLLLPAGRSRSSGGGSYERRAVTWPVRRGWVTIEFRPERRQEVVTVAGFPGTWVYRLTHNLQNVRPLAGQQAA